MSTNSSIAIKNLDGTITGIYCHWDGYLEGVGNKLVKHYDTKEKVNALIALGDISVLGETSECPDGHSFQNPVKGCTIAYGRDRNESGVEAKTFDNYEDFLGWYEQGFDYLFEGSSWIVDGKMFNGVIED